MTAMSGAHSQVCSFTGIYFGLNYSVARGGKGTTEMAGRAVPEHKHHFSLALGREDKHRAIYVLLVSFPRSSQIVTCQGPLEAACTMPEQPQKRQERGGSRARLQARILVAQVGLQQKTLRGCFLSWQVNETVAWFLSVCVCAQAVLEMSQPSQPSSQACRQKSHPFCQQLAQLPFADGLHFEYC